MTQQLALDRIHPRRGFFAAVAQLVRTSISRPRVTTTAPATFDPELRLTTPFALLTGPR